MTLDEDEPKSKLDRFDKENNFHVERFLSEAILRVFSAVFRSLQQRIQNPDKHTWSVRPSSEKSKTRMVVPGVSGHLLQQRLVLAGTFAYELRLRRFLYQN